MKIALAQMQMQALMEENLETALDLIKAAASARADLILFPEIQLSPFFPQYKDAEAEKYLLTVDHDAIRKLCAACKYHGISASPNVYLRENGRNYDASLFIDAAGRIQGISKMVHITTSRFFYEQRYYAPSDDGFKVYATPWGKTGIVICFDRHLPESVRTCAALGADLILIPTANTKAEPLDLFAWEIRVQAMHSGVYIAMCNRVGQEDEMEFAGESIVADPWGNIVIKADGREQLLFAGIDLANSEKARQERPYFRLRRPDMYR